MSSIERRFIPLEFRVLNDGDGNTTPMIRGYASVFNSWSQDLGGFREMIMPGCFARSLANGDDVVALFNHDPSMLLGRRSSGTLTASEDATGLLVEIKPPNTSTGRDVMELVKRGDLKGMSFAFTLPNPKTDQKWTRGEGGDLREIYRANLHDVSVVTDPAYTDTSVGVRSLNQWLATQAIDTRARRMHLAAARIRLSESLLRSCSK